MAENTSTNKCERQKGALVHVLNSFNEIARQAQKVSKRKAEVLTKMFFLFFDRTCESGTTIDVEASSTSDECYEVRKLDGSTYFPTQKNYYFTHFCFKKTSSATTSPAAATTPSTETPPACW